MKFAEMQTKCRQVKNVGGVRHPPFATSLSAAQTRLHSLEVLHTVRLCFCIGAASSSPISALHAETHVPSLSLR